ncbi:hypothetical protein BAUCODRAFT_398032 [Baudoinia panamericana UAMH 10762]|uniref:Copper-fist domain-containing protein n=1 Tax=Baudoinia panamericana (strain UAMH 10762) TaxID=717646 RepID=M2NJG9_BAUPA|nr:uncharacterized protein BAUCODRAFT_398032 [Baudoinia panamericana UAMH 10762]EMC99290.1 hypothetical protein BAUCODRAFT_398032 [Baudoinia panamericana UAMH 10762]
MDQERPFKTIEVIDAQTNQACKIACMSCIRGHRTTSCGNHVCRRKVLWTVKRPGRPSNSCNCQYGANGGCKCVITRTTCPHKPKKGEKRSIECRCDEKGRYCCLLQSEDWHTLMSRQKPTVEFYPTKEVLEAKFARPATVPRPVSMTPMTPALSINSPTVFGSVPSTPGQGGQTLDFQPVTTPFPGYQSPPASQRVARFGMMGVGAPQGNPGHITTDVLLWQGEAPQAPRALVNPSPYYPPIQQEQSSCCLGPVNSSQSTILGHCQHANEVTIDTGLFPPSAFPPFGVVNNEVAFPQDKTPTELGFDFDKLTRDYFNYQFPSAICQTCGLNGCTCRMCPPVMQSNDGSWAQCCGRKHARIAAYVPPIAEHAYIESALPLSTYELQHRAQTSLPTTTAQTSSCPEATIFAETDPPFSEPPRYSDTQTLDPELLESLPPLSLQSTGSFPALGEGTDMDLSDLLMSELDRRTRQQEECCCIHD